MPGSFYNVFSPQFLLSYLYKKKRMLLYVQETCMYMFLPLSYEIGDDTASGDCFTFFNYYFALMGNAVSGYYYNSSNFFHIRSFIV